jgi:SAM-dependent methyltransferase
MSFLKEPLTLGMDPFSEERISIHKKILSKKRMIRDVFNEFHFEMLRLASKHFVISKGEIELGAGVYPVKNTKPGVLATDILPASHLDRTLDAQNMDLKDESISVIYGQNCFHHFPEPELFFKEISRVLTPSGGVVLIEPHYGFFANFIYKRLFSVEGFDKKCQNWHFLPNDLPNQALGYICFIRDRAKFDQLFPSLEIVEVKPALNWMRYLLSGGLNFRQLLPNFTIPILKLLETLMMPLASQLGLHCYYVIKKKTYALAGKI